MLVYHFSCSKLSFKCFILVDSMLAVVYFAVDQHIWNATEIESVAALLTSLRILGVLPEDSVFTAGRVYTHVQQLFSEMQEGRL